MASDPLSASTPTPEAGQDERTVRSQVLTWGSREPAGEWVAVVHVPAEPWSLHTFRRTAAPGYPDGEWRRLVAFADGRPVYVIGEPS